MKKHLKMILTVMLLIVATLVMVAPVNAATDGGGCSTIYDPDL